MKKKKQGKKNVYPNLVEIATEIGSSSQILFLFFFVVVVFCVVFFVYFLFCFILFCLGGGGGDDNQNFDFGARPVENSFFSYVK